MQQRPPNLLEQRLQQQQQQQQQGPMMIQRGPMQMQGHQVMQVGPGGQMSRAPPPNYIGPNQVLGGGMSNPSPNPIMHQGPSPIPSYQGPSPQQIQQPSPGGMMQPSPSSNVNTPMGPASQEDREYLEKVKSLEKYIEPLRNMIAKIGNENDQDRLTKMKKLLDILSNPGRRMPISTLQKCEDVLKRMALEPD